VASRLNVSREIVQSFKCNNLFLFYQKYIKRMNYISY
jgi:hypothetical protein